MVSLAFCFSSYSVTGSRNGNIFLWTGESAGKTIKAHNGEVSILYPHKQTLFSGGEDGVVVLWSFGQGVLTKTLQVADLSTVSRYRPGIRTFDLKSDGTVLLGTRGSELYEGKQGGVFSVLLQGHYEGEVWGCAFSPGNYRFVTCGGDKTLRLWDVAGKRMLVGTDPFENDVRAVDWASSGKFLVVGDSKARLFLLDAGTLQVQASVQCNLEKSVGKGREAEPWIEDLKIAPGGGLVAVGTHGGASNIEIFAVGNNKLSSKGIIKAGLTSALTHLDFSSDGEYLVVNSQAYELKFCSVQTLKNISASNCKDVEWFTWTCKGIEI